ncbi:M48 family metallopeptidase [Brevundimonas lenta]|uniref:Membrane-associated protease RseP (Regulator of RpoE activity) n=1 Tax=Brevundimonas lenta TaxID=424796 RepID=A0A7W6JFI1_9CAUL|nr:M48 family metallopeptidase [Brevundimonas lenta]MBB4084141.1 membrane-associated protease RseP (regulator of RpoE activity) [Brevundimonas lenta]
MPIRARTLAAVVVLGLAPGLACCGHPAPKAGVVEAGPEARLDALNALDIRVANVSWRLAVANAELCPVVRTRAGWTLQSASQYGAELRPLAVARYGLDGDLPGVLAAPPGSPADQAGLSRGDLILAVDGRPLERGQDGAESYEGLQANIAVLDAAAARGRVELKVRRDGVERVVTIRPQAACAYPTEVEVTGALRSRADGRYIFISDGMAGLAADDDQLAFILGHELAHAVLEHRTQPDVTGVRGASNWAISMTKGLSIRSEADADRMGLFLVARAGFDPYKAVEFLTRYEQADGRASYAQINAGGVYENASGRRRALQPVLANIADLKAADRALIP